MKVFGVLSLIAVVSARPQQQYNYNGPIGGASALSDATAPAATIPSYQFSYDVNALDNYNNQVNYGHTEAREGDVTRGEYFVLLPDTRLMRVSYYADATGFHPTYTYEGTAVFPQATQQYAAAAPAPASQQFQQVASNAVNPQQFQQVLSNAVNPLQPVSSNAVGNGYQLPAGK